jgi:putative transposase
MPRLPRLTMPNVAQHVVQRGNNRQAIFFAEEDYSTYLDYLREALPKNDCQLFAFVLMTNHVHLLVSGKIPGVVSALMQSIGRRYVRYCNAKYQRTGTLFEGRFKSSLIDSERYLLTCMRYIERNPVRAGMVSDPAEYPWSSYRHHIADLSNPMLTEPREYLRLDLNAEQRALAYRAFFKKPLASGDLDAIRAHLHKDCALGSSRFQQKIERASGRRANIVQQGRPRKLNDDEEK